MSLMSQEILKDSTMSFSEKKGNNPGKLLSQYALGEGFFKDNLIASSTLNTVGNYKVLKDLVSH